MQNAFCAGQGHDPASFKNPIPGKQKKAALFKTLLLMKPAIILCAFSLLQAHANGYSQLITLQLKNALLEKAINAIEEQSGYHFIYTKEEIAKAKPVNITVNLAPLEKVLSICFNDQPLDYRIDEKYIVLKRKEGYEKTIPADTLRTLRGKIVNEKGEAIAGASIQVKGKPIASSSDANGNFVLTGVAPDATLIISGAELNAIEIRPGRQEFVSILLPTKVSDLDQVLVMAYGETTKRLNTGNIGKVSAEEISRQPVSNPLAAMQGRIAGMTITATSGIPGAAYKVLIRGQNSILNGTDPLFIIDGIPFAAGNNPINQITTAAILSPLQLIDPATIESIEVLKDAEATAIYGSRGANGVILITTKKGIEGKTQFSANVQYGGSRVTRTMDMLSLKDYLAMRREALANDGAVPNQYNAPDLVLWDTTRYTDLKKLLIGGTAHTTNAQVNVSGGNANTNFLLGAGYYKETTVFPTELGNKRMNVHLNLGHVSANNRFKLSLSGNYVYNQNKLTVFDLTSSINYAPNIQLFDSSGKLNWQEKGITFNSVGAQNPLANMNTKYTGVFQNLLSNLSLQYNILPQLAIKANLGYNLVLTDETRLNPSNSFDPYGPASLPYALFVNGQQKSWIAEPQAEYKIMIAKGKLSVMAGFTLQENEYKNNTVNAEDYQSDLLLGSIAGAARVRAQNSYSQYRYNAVFGRIQYNWEEKYILHLSGRRDGSSRFGPDKRFSQFGAISGAWIFSKEKWMKAAANIISFGKIRSSNGSTGSDNIGDYLYHDVWNATPITYQGIPAINPSSLFNPNLAWETTKKFEAGLEMGFLKDRIFLSVSYFSNSSGNQLMPYALPAQTGFGSVNKNFEALIRNRGYELVISSTNINTQNFSWRSSLNMSRTRNKLVAFPGLANSSYASVYIVGEPVSARRVFEYTGVDAATGVYTFNDVDHNGILELADMMKFKTTDPPLYGGVSNSLRYKNLQLDIFFEFKKQEGLNYLNNIGFYPPGYNVKNQPSIVLDRWQKPGDKTSIAKYTGVYGTPGYFYTVYFLPSSDAVYSDASYIRCKNIALWYSLPERWLSKLKLSSNKIFVQAQNLFTITDYKGADPETQNLYALPPLKTISAGIQLTF
ncbi:MAG: SusC/RagA family TonB-linked outer membrane protein [Chitinophagaceae bacterium]